MKTIHILKHSNSTESDALLRAVDKAYLFIDPTLEEFNPEAHRKQLYAAHKILLEEKKVKLRNKVKLSSVL